MITKSWKDKINFNTILASIFILFSLAAYLLIPYQIAKPKLFMGRAMLALKPTLFPRLAVLALLGLSVWYLFRSFSLREKHLFRELGWESYLRILVSLVVFVAYALLFEPLGFVFSSILVVGVLALYYGYRNIPIFIIAVIGIPSAIYFIFTRLLKVSLPECPFF